MGACLLHTCAHMHLSWNNWSTASKHLLEYPLPCQMPCRCNMVPRCTTTSTTESENPQWDHPMAQEASQSLKTTSIKKRKESFDLVNWATLKGSNISSVKYFEDYKNADCKWTSLFLQKQRTCYTNSLLLKTTTTPSFKRSPPGLSLPTSNEASLWSSCKSN